MNSTFGLDRRAFCGIAAQGALLPLAGAFGAQKRQRWYPIGACDWSLNRRGKVGALALASQLGLDGVEIAFGPPGKGDDPREPANRKRYAAAVKEHGVEIASLGMAALNRVPLADSDRAERWVEQAIGVAEKMGLRTILLACFSKGDLLGKPAKQRRLVRRLKRLAPKAEQAGVVLGIESWLNVDQHIALLDAAGSDHVQVYYDVANMAKKGYDVPAEIRKLGADRICQIHAKAWGHLLGEGRVDFRDVRAALDEIGYRDWLIIESATPKGMDVREAYTANRKHLRSIFPTGPQ